MSEMGATLSALCPRCRRLRQTKRSLQTYRTGEVHVRVECATCRTFLRFDSRNSWPGEIVKASEEGKPRVRAEDHPGEGFEEIYDVTVYKITENAILVDFDDETYWIPKSVIENPGSLACASYESIRVKGWFLRKEEMI